MTRHKHAHTGLVTPPLPQLLLTAALHLFAMLASNVASTLRMCFRRPVVNATRPTSHALPGERSDIQQQEPNQVAASDNCPVALMVSSTQSVRPSNHEGVFTLRATPTASFSGLSRESRLAQHRDHQLTVPLIPAKAGTQSYNGTRVKISDQRMPPWIPAFAGTSGDRTAPNKNAAA